MMPNQGAAANRRPAGQSDGSGNLFAIVAADRAFPAAVAELGRSPLYSMRLSILIISIMALVCCGGWSARSETTNTVLQFFVVSQEKVEGGQFINTPELANVGYIAAKPDLVITKLQAVSISSDNSPDAPAALSVRLQPEDAKRFAILTKKSIGKRLLLMLGNKPLTAPRVMSSLEGGGFLIEFQDRAELKKTEEVLNKLCV